MKYDHQDLGLVSAEPMHRQSEHEWPEVSSTQKKNSIDHHRQRETTDQQSQKDKSLRLPSRSRNRKSAVAFAAALPAGAAALAAPFAAASSQVRGTYSNNEWILMNFIVLASANRTSILEAGVHRLYTMNLRLKEYRTKYTKRARTQQAPWLLFCQLLLEALDPSLMWFVCSKVGA